MNIFITGASGFLGKAILSRLLQKNSSSCFYLLLRPTRRLSAQDRLDVLLQQILPESKHMQVRQRIKIIPGDLTKPHLGLSSEHQKLLINKAHHILHIGASTDFSAPLDQARLYNVEGTRSILNLAQQARQAGVLQRFDYISTAFVAGTKPGWVTEQDLNRNQSFANSYEQSKFEAEQLVHDAKIDLPMTCIIRPSIIVGDSLSGYTPHFKVLYWPLRLLATQGLPFFACNLSANLDVVPIDFVANAIVSLSEHDDTKGETFYLTAGPGHEVQIKELLADAQQFARIKPTPVLPFWLFHTIRTSPLAKLYPPEFWQAVEMARPYYSYLKGTGVVFDNRRSHAYLKKLGLTPPRWNDYKRVALSYCFVSHWGKKPPLPEYCYYIPSANQFATSAG